MTAHSSSAISFLRVSHLTKSFRGLRALQDVNLELQEGEIRGIIGPNGAGKTTFFNCLTGQNLPTERCWRKDDRAIFWQNPDAHPDYDS